jgi:uncharacterized protein with FMN-binding domain
MKKITLAVLVIGSFIIFCLLYNYNQTTINAALPPNTSTSSDSSSSSSSSSVVSATPGTSGTAGGTGTSGALYKDGTYTGSVADAQWGYVQIQAVIQNGKITSVSFLQHPSDRSRSVTINDYADPQLVNEAIQVQSAQVDIVTGATDTSDAFIQSLSDALSQAKA